jgi:hypothetical protein
MKTGEHRHAREGAGALPRVARSLADHLSAIARLRGASLLRLGHPVTARLLGDARLGTLAQQYARWLRSRARRPASEPASRRGSRARACAASASRTGRRSRHASG